MYASKTWALLNEDTKRIEASDMILLRIIWSVLQEMIGRNTLSRFVEAER